MGRNGGFIEEGSFLLGRQLIVTPLGVEDIDGLMPGWFTGLAMILSPPERHYGQQRQIDGLRHIAVGQCRCRQTAGNGRRPHQFPYRAGLNMVKARWPAALLAVTASGCGLYSSSPVR